MEFIILYFVINIIIALIVWWAYLPEKVSRIGYFLMMLFFGLPLIIILVVFVIVVLGAGTSYVVGSTIGGASSNVGEAIGNWFGKVLGK